MIEGKRTIWLGPAAEAQVTAAEASLGLTFPAEYRRFLLTHGCGLVDGIELFGLGEVDGEAPDLLWLARTLQNIGLVRPAGVIPIAEVGNGDYVVVLARAHGDMRVGSLAYWNPRRDDTVDLAPAAESLVQWVASTRAR